MLTIYNRNYKSIIITQLNIEKLIIMITNFPYITVYLIRLYSYSLPSSIIMQCHIVCESKTIYCKKNLSNMENRSSKERSFLPVPCRAVFAGNTAACQASTRTSTGMYINVHFDFRSGVTRNKSRPERNQEAATVRLFSPDISWLICFIGCWMLVKRFALWRDAFFYGDAYRGWLLSLDGPKKYPLTQLRPILCIKMKMKVNVQQHNQYLVCVCVCAMPLHFLGVPGQWGRIFLELFRQVSCCTR